MSKIKGQHRTKIGLSIDDLDITNEMPEYKEPSNLTETLLMLRRLIKEQKATLRLMEYQINQLKKILM